jgi:predicted MFS family arabinose efflux permease
MINKIYENEKYNSLPINNKTIENQSKLIKDEKQISNIPIYLIYTLITLINLIVNMDSGNVLPVINEVKYDLGINSTQVGAFSSLVSLGTFIGGLVSFTIIDKFSRKLILFFANLGIVICLFTFPMNIFNNIWILFLNRILVGGFMVSILYIICQVF